MEIHAASEPAHEGRANEDAYACLDDFVIVADGATAPTSLGSGCLHGPRWYARQLVSNAVASHVNDAQHPLSDILGSAIQATTDGHADTCDTRHPGTPSATVVMLKRVSNALHWLVLGDATLLIDAQGDVQVITDRRLSHTSKHEREAVLHGGDADGFRAQRIAALSEAQRRFRNVEGGFWIAAADPAAAQHSLTGKSIAAAKIPWQAALFTDGASAAVDTYSMTDWKGALDLLAKSGPNDFLRSIREVEKSDPDARIYPRIKSADDATVVYATGVETLSGS